MVVFETQPAIATSGVFGADFGATTNGAALRSGLFGAVGLAARL
jgi:hypothetical protein